MLLLSPANLSGRRTQMLLSPKALFALAEQLHSAHGAPLGEVFSFVSGLYFRGKMSYACSFGRAPGETPTAWVMTAGGGLCRLSERIRPERIRAWSAVSIHEDNPHFTAPLLRHASALLEAFPADARFVLLGSVATSKYVGPLLEVFGERLLFPAAFVGRGDMSRGALLLDAVRAQRELEYAPVAGTALHGTRPPRRR